MDYSNIMPQRYTVERARIMIKSEEVVCYFVCDDGVPAVEINRHLIIQRQKRNRAVSTTAYYLKNFLNFLANNGIEYTEVKKEHVIEFMDDISMNHSYGVLRHYGIGIANLYEDLANRNFTLDKSLYLPTAGPAAMILKDKYKDKRTCLSSLIDEYLPMVEEKWVLYTKWYSEEQIFAISNELPFVHRCIFWITILLGYRADSAFSITMKSLSLRRGMIEPTRSKTNKTHVSMIPPLLKEMLNTYIVDIRSEIVERTGSDSEYLFLCRNGNPVNYHAYNQALKRAGEKAMKKNPQLEIDTLHTHAGRATFAAALRTYQLEKQRKGESVFSDADFIACMDWRDIKNLEHYDSHTRVQEISPLLTAFYDEYLEIATENRVSTLLPFGTKKESA